MPRKGFRVPPPGWGSKPLGWNRPGAIPSTGTDDSEQFERLLKEVYESIHKPEPVPGIWVPEEPQGKDAYEVIYRQYPAPDQQPIRAQREDVVISVFSIQFSVISESVSYRLVTDNKGITNLEHIGYKWGAKKINNLRDWAGRCVRVAPFNLV